MHDSVFCNNQLLERGAPQGAGPWHSAIVTGLRVVPVTLTCEYVTVSLQQSTAELLVEVSVLSN